MIFFYISIKINKRKLNQFKEIIGNGIKNVIKSKKSIINIT